MERGALRGVVGDQVERAPAYPPALLPAPLLDGGLFVPRRGVRERVRVARGRARRALRRRRAADAAAALGRGVAGRVVHDRDGARAVRAHLAVVDVDHGQGQRLHDAVDELERRVRPGLAVLGVARGLEEREDLQRVQRVSPRLEDATRPGRTIAASARVWSIRWALHAASRAAWAESRRASARPRPAAPRSSSLERIRFDIASAERTNAG